VLELAILGLLEEQELHGYEIRRRLREELGFLANVSFGSLYPALARLERSGALEAVDEAPGSPGFPMTGSLSGERAAFWPRRGAPARSRRGRKVYRITEEGRRQFAALLAAEPSAGEDARSFGLRLAFARYLPPSARLRLLERRRVQLLERLEAARRVAAHRQLDLYARSLAEHAQESTERDISWLDRLIAAERAVLGNLDPPRTSTADETSADPSSPSLIPAAPAAPRSAAAAAVTKGQS
jgi:DNA-binding PadR family transcriptional regulator